MSEVDSHYGATVTGRRGPAAPSEPEGRWSGASGKAADLRDQATRAAGNVRDRVGSAYGQASDWASDSLDTASRNALYARRRTVGEFNRGRRQVVGFVEENPVMVGVAGLAAGLLIGALLPGTRRENQAFGRYADDARREGFRYAQTVAEQGRQVLEENLRGVRSSLDRDTGDETERG